MKKYIFILIFFSNFLFSQEENNKIIYFDSIWNETNFENHKYYRKVIDYNLFKEEYIFEDYYKSGKIKMRGNSISKESLYKNGEFTYFYENGNIKETAFYMNGVGFGQNTQWYENGQKKLEGEYIYDEVENIPLLKINSFWDKQNIQKVVDGNGEVEDINESFSEKGILKNGLKDGVWTGKDNRYKLSYTEKYKDGKFISGTSIDSQNNQYNYNKLFLNPQPIDGLEKFYQNIGKNFKIPKSAERISGKIILKFTINTEGMIEDISVTKKLTPDLDNEAIRVLKKCTPWNAAEFKGMKVKTLYNLPITIQTPDTE